MYKFSYRSSCFTYITVIYSYTSPPLKAFSTQKKYRLRQTKTNLRKPLLMHPSLCIVLFFGEKEY